MFVGFGAGLILLGFLAYLAFERWRVPDFMFLILLGVLIGPAGADLVSPSTRVAIDGLAPLFTAVAVAFLLFEGGVRLPLRGLGRPVALILVHTAVVATISSALAWLVLTRVFHLSSLGALVLAAATIGPSASIVLSFAPRLRLDARARSTVLLEGVVANVLSFLVIAVLAQVYGTAAGGQEPTRVVAGAGIAVLAAVTAGLGWLRVTRRLQGTGAVHTATLGVVLALYALANGPMGGHGAIAAFAFGLVLGNRNLFDRAAGAVPATEAHDTDLARFHGEVTFFIRTFFFVYLGLLFDPRGLQAAPLLVGAALTAIFLAARYPTASLLGRAWRLPRSDVRVVRGTVARGLSDAVVVVYGIQVGLVAPAEGGLLTSSLLVLVMLSAAVTALLVLLAERARAAAPAPAPAGPPRFGYDEYPEAPLLAGAPTDPGTR